MENINKEQVLKKYTEFIDKQSKGSIPLFIAIVGSQAYGTNVPGSDFDFAGVFLQPEDEIYGFNYLKQIDEKKKKSDFGNAEKDDAVFYEIKRFIQLLGTANPTVLSILFTPDDCVVYKHPSFDILLNRKQDFITKMCANSFAGFAVSQLKKAKGLDKKQNWEKDRVEKKDVIDFCYVIDESGYGTMPLKKYLEDNDMDQKFCGVTKVPNARDLYAVFYDHIAHNCFYEGYSEEIRDNYKNLSKEAGKGFGKGYKGISKVGEGNNVAESNQLRLSSIPKGEFPVRVMVYNKDSYTKSCKDYKSYKEWLENRNEQRYTDVKGHGQKIDGKNVMHLVRLLRMSREIAENGEFIIRRPDAEYLKSIRLGKVSLQEIIDWSESEIKEIDRIFKDSSLPFESDRELSNNLLVKIRKEAYKK